MFKVSGGAMDVNFDRRALYYAARVLLDPRASLTEDEEEIVVDALQELNVETEFDWSDRVLSDMLINKYLRYRGIPPHAKRAQMMQIVEQYEGAAVVVPPRAAVPQPEDKKRQRAKQSASDNIICERLNEEEKPFWVVDTGSLSTGVAISPALYQKVVWMSADDIILKLQTDRFMCFARPEPNNAFKNDRAIGLSTIVAEALDFPTELTFISLCHNFPVIRKIAVSGAGTEELDVFDISAEVTKLQVLFIGLRLFKNTISIAKLYDEDGNEMDVGKIPLYRETEIPIEVVTPSIDRRMRFVGRKKINWF